MPDEDIRSKKVKHAGQPERYVEERPHTYFCKKVANNTTYVPTNHSSHPTLIFFLF